MRRQSSGSIADAAWAIGASSVIAVGAVAFATFVLVPSIRTLLILGLVVPSALMWAESLAVPEPPLMSVTSSIEIDGTGVGATRTCWFSTGAFVEPIIHTPNLDGYFVSRQGQFHLIAVDENRTRLEGTTWYEHALWPAAYWRLWSDYIIHRIHMRVLRHIKNSSETDR